MPNAFTLEYNTGIIEKIPISQIRINRNCYSYRFNLDRNREENIELTKSIKTNGLLHPLIVISKDDFYWIISGRRRFIACKKLGFRKVMAHIVEVTDKEAFEISLAENIHRKKLEPIEEAEAYRKYVFEYGWGGISDLAFRINKSISYVDRRIRLLNLPDNAILYLYQGLLSPSVAEELLVLKEKEKQSELAEIIKTKKLSSRSVRCMVKETEQHNYDFTGIMPIADEIIGMDKESQKYFNQAIIAIRIAMNHLSRIIESTENNWVLYERLMYYKNILHQQIDYLIKDKKKFRW